MATRATDTAGRRTGSHPARGGARRTALAAWLVSAACGPIATGAALAQAAVTTPWHLERIHAAGTHLAGMLGAGVPVALVDTGLRASHADLQGSVLSGYSVVNASWVTHDWLGHGTHVAGIVASHANGPAGPGVAPGAQLVPVQIFSTGTTTDAVLAAGIRYAGTRATIINLSLTAGGPVAVSAMQEAISRGGLIVAAAGNGAAANPDWPARFARESWANGPGRDGALIAVGAVDRNNRLAAFSNRAGDAASWFLVAPGVDIVSSDAYDETGHVAMSGTSMAAPMVSGTAALLKGHWPRLRAGQIAGILLATATDLGAPGVDAVYGRGLLNVEAAMRPVGALRTMTATGLQPLSGAALRLSAATSALAVVAGQGGLRLAGVDDFERDYATDAGLAVSSPPGMRLDSAFAGLDRRFNATRRATKRTDRLSLEIDPPLAWSGSPYAATGGRATMPAVSVIARDGAGVTGFGTGGTASRFFGLGGLSVDSFGTEVALADVTALANPYLSLVPQATHVARGVRMVDATFKAGVVAGVNAWEPGAGWGRVSAGAAVLEAAHAMPFGGTATLGYAVAQESGAYLGGVGVGPLSLGNRVRTESLQASAAWPVAPATVVAGSVSVGYTPAVRGGAGLMAGSSAVQSQAMSVALVRADALVAGDRVGLSLAQPMRVTAGQMRFDVQTEVDASGAPVMETRQFSLVPQGRERLGEISYLRPVGRQSALIYSAAYRHQPNHRVGVPGDTLLAVRYLLDF